METTRITWSKLRPFLWSRLLLHHSTPFVSVCGCVSVSVCVSVCVCVCVCSFDPFSAQFPVGDYFKSRRRYLNRLCGIFDLTASSLLHLQTLGSFHPLPDAGFRLDGWIRTHPAGMLPQCAGMAGILSSSSSSFSSSASVNGRLGLLLLLPGSILLRRLGRAKNSI